jgi:hypothetical protein
LNYHFILLFGKSLEVPKVVVAGLTMEEIAVVFLCQMKRFSLAQLVSLIFALIGLFIYS